MKERPIIFNAEMVRAILDGRKTQTRRVVKPGTVDDWNACPYGQIGDRLWVRESFRQAYQATSFSSGIIYRADKSRSLGMDEYSDRHRWKPSIHMPRIASRITIELTDVRVQRVQEITEGEAEAEGAPLGECTDSPSCRAQGFIDLWNSINAKRGYGWDVNPWVWALTFKVVR